DTVRFFERLPSEKADTLGFPTCAFQLSGELVVFDRFSQMAQVISNVYIPESKRSPKNLKALYAQGLRAIDRQITRIQSVAPATRRQSRSHVKAPKPLMTRQAFEKAVTQAKEYIRAGDIIQVVLSQRWEIEPHASSFDVYRSLRMVNPSPYMYHL